MHGDWMAVEFESDVSNKLNDKYGEHYVSTDEGRPGNKYQNEWIFRKLSEGSFALIYVYFYLY